MNRTRLKFNNRTEWLEARKGGIGASEVASVIGLNPWETPYQLWRRKLGIDAPKEENFAMKAGHYLEDAVAKFFEDESGLQIINSTAEDFMFINPDKPFLRVSPDRLFWLPDGVRNDDNKGVLECKTTQKSIDAEDLPKHWFCQIQMNLGVAGYEQGALAWLTAGREFGYKNITFDPEFFDFLCDEVSRFWIDNIQGGKEPDAVSVSDILLKFNRHTEGKQIEVGEDIFSAYKDLKDLRKQMDAMDEQKTALEDKIKFAFGDAEAITFGGETLATWKTAKASQKFDAKAFQKAQPDLYKSFCTEVQGSRRFLLK